MTHPPGNPSEPKPPGPPTGPGRPRLVAEYAEAYGIAYRWLFDHCPPWRWLLSAGMVPGSPLARTLADACERSLGHPIAA